MTTAGSGTLVSRSPFGDAHTVDLDPAGEQARLEAFVARYAGSETTVVAVQGLGFVGAGMAAALAEARTPSGAPRFAVIGVDLPDEANYWKIARVRDGQPPVRCDDARMRQAYQRAAERGNLTATFSERAYAGADVVVVDVNLDIVKPASGTGAPRFSYDPFLAAVGTVARVIAPETLVGIETTVPPGTTAKVVRPLFARTFEERRIDPARLRLAHSYERVMPGPGYLASITDFYRVYAGIDGPSSRRARAFFESFINTAEFPLSELASPTASEMAKVLENAFRATNIAFMQEWTEFAEAAGVDLFSVIGAIRARPTHRNIMAPGFGVGGYCLPKDPLLADWALQTHFGGARRLDMSLEAVRVNDRMPEHTFALLRRAVGSLRGHRVALLGVSYLEGVADTRSSPAAVFYDRCREAGAVVSLHDPMLEFWPERQVPVHRRLDALAGQTHDTVVFAVRHPVYLELTADAIVDAVPEVGQVIDANNIVTDQLADALAARGIRVFGVGKGHWTGRDRPERSTDEV
jgi:UDP-N-acetyl-D-glucosamine dehydrogenase